MQHLFHALFLGKKTGAADGRVLFRKNVRWSPCDSCSLMEKELCGRPKLRALDSFIFFQFVHGRLSCGVAVYTGGLICLAYSKLLRLRCEVIFHELPGSRVCNDRCEDRFRSFSKFLQMGVYEAIEAG